jgi:hypothetical protein
MSQLLLRLYLVVRQPRNFLILLCVFIGVSLLLHFLRGYDGDWGATNLILSIEASTASAVLMMLAEEAAERQKEQTEYQTRMLKHLEELEERILSAITEGKS